MSDEEKGDEVVWMTAEEFEERFIRENRENVREWLFPHICDLLEQLYLNEGNCSVAGFNDFFYDKDNADHVAEMLCYLFCKYRKKCEDAYQSEQN